MSQPDTMRPMSAYSTNRTIIWTRFKAIHLTKDRMANKENTFLLTWVTVTNLRRNSTFMPRPLWSSYCLYTLVSIYIMRWAGGSGQTEVPKRARGLWFSLSHYVLEKRWAIKFSTLFMLLPLILRVRRVRLYPSIRYVLEIMRQMFIRSYSYYRPNFVLLPERVRTNPRFRKQKIKS